MKATQLPMHETLVDTEGRGVADDCTRLVNGVRAVDWHGIVNIQGTPFFVLLDLRLLRRLVL